MIPGSGIPRPDKIATRIRNGQNRDTASRPAESGPTQPRNPEIEGNPDFFLGLASGFEFALSDSFVSESQNFKNFKARDEN